MSEFQRVDRGGSVDRVRDSERPVMMRTERIPVPVPDPWRPRCLGGGQSIVQAPVPWRPVLAWLLTALWASLLAGGTSGCTASSHATRSAPLGEPIALAEVEALLEEPGPIELTRVVAADWQVARSGLINLDHPRAEEAGIEDGPEEIEIYFYVLEHPVEGTFMVDSGVDQRFRSDERHPAVSALVASVMQTEALEIHTTTAEWLAERSEPVAGVFLTHIHLDHVMGLLDLPKATPAYVGPGEVESRGFLNLFTRGTIDRMLAEVGPLAVWPVPAVPGNADGISGIDVFGDASLFALHVPGHTPGSMAFLARTPDGPQLMVGDTSHTRWGWENEVEPGTFTANSEDNARSLAWLRDLVERHPGIEVHLGHQRLSD